MEKEKRTALVERARHHDADAFAALYSGYYKALYKTAYYILGNAQDAEDTVMETVADAFAGIGQLRVADAFEGWLFRILYNKSRRKRGVAVYKATLELNEEIEADDRHGDATENIDLLRALETLTREERTIVVLAVCEGYSSQDIGRVMRLNANTVRSKQMRALAKMRTILEKE